MARPSRKPTPPTKPLLKAPMRIGSFNAAATISELRRLHAAAEDPDLDQMAADDEVYQALLYLEAHAGALKTESAQREAAVYRVKLWEYVREQTDVHQAKAIAHARAAGVEWADLAPAMAVNAPSAAYNKAVRMRAALLVDPDTGGRALRRTPEAVLEAERAASARVAAEHRAQAEAERRHRVLAPVAQRLLDHRSGLDNEENVTYWLDQIDAVLPCQTPTQFVSLETYVQATVRALRQVERTTARPAATTVDAQLAYAAAVELLPQ
ncbi:hypothetical protein [Streptomyces sp. NBC_00989]|uniref:hypothetical protein n=1 Tax=Streptomyces sp. NBC_00989 TaxID=2903705 RepID=UPI002F91576C|nr:hypothetical protein OG714_55130 [Streptomyces sp. NBC_00989]